MTAAEIQVIPTASATPKARIQALDLIRGLAILGILAVNADGFAATISASLRPETWPFPNEGWTAISFWIVKTFFHEKFLTIFSMLFGVSLFLVGGERADRARGRVLWRRLAVLFGLAMLHGFGIWWGDILSLYAVTGMIMLFCRSWRPRTLLIVGIALYAAMGIRDLPPAVLSFGSHEVVATTQPVDQAAQQATSERRKASAAADIAEARSSWSAAYAANTKSYLRLLSGYLHIWPSTLGLMMIGLGLFKSGFLAGRSSARVYGAAIGVGAVALTVVGWLAWRSVILESPVLASHSLDYTLAPLISLGYVGALILLWRAGAALAPLAAAGRMAFTNYLTQSLIMTTIFYGGRGGLMGEIDRPGLWAIVIGIWTLQLIWSPLWLSRFEMGPLEWVWRCLTVGRRVPLRKQA
ncbi:DUF418 domain-containing protein [Brevundimonas sp.]|uniref:DUF418 domain-containing protein n=1 Tax=Brevundimonas sp. TaxID=1871086 RepID=UPI003BA99FAC